MKRGSPAPAVIARWDDLRLLLAVADSGSLTAAAANSGASQPTLSRRIKALEASLETTLLRRVDDHYRLTPAGETIVGLVRQMAAAASAIERQVGANAESPTGRVRLATTECVAASWLVQQLPVLEQRYPDLELEILTDVGFADLTRREADIAIRIGVSGADGLHTEHVGSVRFDLYGSQHYLDRNGMPQTLDDLSHHVGIDSLRELARVPQAVAFREAMGGELPVACNSILGQLQGVRSGLGLMVLPRYLAIADAKLVPLLPQVFGSYRDLWLVCHADLLSTARFKVTWEFLRRALRADARQFSDAH